MAAQFTNDAGRRIIRGVRAIEGITFGQTAPPKNPRHPRRGDCTIEIDVITNVTITSGKLCFCRKRIKVCSEEDIPSLCIDLTACPPEA